MPQTCIRQDRLILTMMQSCASAAKLRAAGPFFRSASVKGSNTVSRHLGSSIGSRAERQRERRMVLSAMLVPVSPFRTLDVKRRPPVAPPW